MRGKKWKLGGHPWADITTFFLSSSEDNDQVEGGMLVNRINDKFASGLLRSQNDTERSRFQNFQRNAEKS